jgi:hypothetical protein
METRIVFCIELLVVQRKLFIFLATLYFSAKFCLKTLHELLCQCHNRRFNLRKRSIPGIPGLNRLIHSAVDGNLAAALQQELRV